MFKNIDFVAFDFRFFCSSVRFVFKLMKIQDPKYC